MPKKSTKFSSSSEFPILGDLGLYPAPTKGDGNCLFRALSDQVYGDETHHGELRRLVVAYVKDNEAHFAAFVGEFGETFDQYITRLAQDGVYGGHIEIVGFAQKYRKPVVIYQAETLYIVEPQDIPRSEWEGSAHVAYHTWEHYSSVRKVGGPQSGPIQIDIPQLNDIKSREADSETLQAEVPPWKIEIVLRSVPDALESTVTAMLRTKDYDQVIEELLMAEFDTDPHKDTEAPSQEVPAQEEPTQEEPTQEEPTQEGPTQESSAQDKNQTNAEDTEAKAPNSQPVKGAADRKMQAKQRRAEKKERVRMKKLKGKHQPAADTKDATDESQNSKSPDAHRIILI